MGEKRTISELNCAESMATMGDVVCLGEPINVDDCESEASTEDCDSSSSSDDSGFDIDDDGSVTYLWTDRPLVREWFATNAAQLDCKRLAHHGVLSRVLHEHLPFEDYEFTMMLAHSAPKLINNDCIKLYADFMVYMLGMESINSLDALQTRKAALRTNGHILRLYAECFIRGMFAI